MKKWISKSESTRKTKQNKPFQKILTSVNDDNQSQQMLTALGLTWQRGKECRVEHVRLGGVAWKRMGACYDK